MFPFMTTSSRLFVFVFTQMVSKRQYRHMTRMSSFAQQPFPLRQEPIGAAPDTSPATHQRWWRFYSNWNKQKGKDSFVSGHIYIYIFYTWLNVFATPSAGGEECQNDATDCAFVLDWRQRYIIQCVKTGTMKTITTQLNTTANRTLSHIFKQHSKQ